MLSSIFARSRRVIAASAITILLSSGLCLATDFSAQMITKFGNKSVQGKLYVSGSNWRQEASVQGHQQIVIARGKTVYTLNPALKQYQVAQSAERPWSASAMAKMFSPGTNRKSCGKTTINGIACEKIVYTSKQAPGSVTQYIAKDLDLPVKTQISMQQGSFVTEFKNIKKGTPPAALFDIPKGYKKVSLPKSAIPSGKHR